jgi:STE24 endopeptidase
MMHLLRPQRLILKQLLTVWGLMAFPESGLVADVRTNPDYAPLQEVAVAQPSPEAEKFHNGNQWIWAVSQCISVALPLMMLLTGLAAVFERWSMKLGLGHRFPAVGLYVALMMAFSFAVRLPWSYAAGYLRMKAYGLSNQTVPAWLGDSLKSLAVGILIQSIVIGVVWGLLVVRFPRMWWFWSAAGTMPFLILGAFLAPLLIDPLFNRFGPMKDQALEHEILELADRTGVGSSRVFEVDKSRQTKAVNAYVTGMFGSKRIVLWDTLLSALPGREVKAVVAHELGHYVLGHVRLGVLIGGVSAFVGMFLLDFFLKWSVATWGIRLGVTEWSGLSALPVLVLLITLGELLASPATNLVSRYMEREADRFAIELTRDPAAFAHAFVALQRENLSVPYPGWFYRTWRATHPTIGQRIEFANSYRPWVQGQSGRYDHRMKPPSE